MKTNLGILLLSIVAVIYSVWTRNDQEKLSRPNYSYPDAAYIYRSIGKLQPRYEQQIHIFNIDDGDTITLNDGRKIRLCGIDSPDMAQSLGMQARAKLQELIEASDGTILVQEIEPEFNDRTVADVFLKNGKLLSAELIRLGVSYRYGQYARNCPNDREIAVLESQAKSQKIGVWSSDHQRPWDYRIEQRIRERDF